MQRPSAQDQFATPIDKCIQDNDSETILAAHVELRIALSIE